MTILKQLCSIQQLNINHIIFNNSVYSNVTPTCGKTCVEVILQFKTYHMEEFAFLLLS